MAAVTRLKGQDMVVAVTHNNNPVEISKVMSFEYSHQMDTTEQGFLGESSDEKDSVYKGVKGEFKVQVPNANIFHLIDAVVAQVRSRTSGDKFNLTLRRKLPGADSELVTTFSDISFGEIGHSVSGRTEYEEVTLPFSCPEAITAPA